MDKDTIFKFAKRIFNSSSVAKAMISLSQLQTILKEQGASEDYIELIEKMLQSVPEMKQISEKEFLTEEDVEIAVRRARERKIREEAARAHGRC